MSWKYEWKTVFFPEFDSGGLSLTRDQVALRIFENAESPATTGTISAAWTGTNVTVTRETAAPLSGEGSVKVVVAGGAGSVYKTLDRAKFGYPFPGHNAIRIRYVRFKATCDTGSETVRVTFGDVSDANHYRYWNITVAQSKYVEYIVDLNPDNTESYPAPTTGSTTWDPENIDRFGFTNLSTGRTFYFDDISFIYEYSLPDVLGFSSETAAARGDIASINARINGLWDDVKSLEGQTQQYAKQGIAVAEMNQACQWALELNSEFAPPVSTTEIEPGNYKIDQIRGATTTPIVVSTPASESDGTIYASYTPLEAVWNIGDLIKVTFSGGYVRTDVTPTELLTANATAGNAYVDVDNAYQWQVGWTVRVYDDVNGSEYMTVSELTSPTRVTFTGNLAANHTTANNAGIVRDIKTILSTAVFFTMLQSEAQSFKILATGTLTTSSTTVPADNTGRLEVDNYWNGSWLMPIAGNAANQPRLIVDFANTGGVFTLDGDQPFTTLPGAVEYVIIGTNSQLVPAVDSTNNQTPAHVIGNKIETPVPLMSGVPLTSGSASVAGYLKALIARGMAAIQGTCDSGMGASTTTIVSDDLIGYGDNYFNNHFWMQVIKNYNSAGAVPEGELRLITDYTSNTGTFVTDAFSANVEASDAVVILHESLVFAWQKLTQLQTNFFMSDYDVFDTAAAATVNTNRWTGEEYIVGAASTSTANINTTTSGKAYVLADGVAAPTGYWLRHKPARQSEFFSAIIDANYTFSNSSTNPMQGGLFVTKGIAYDSQNYLFIGREKSGTVDNIIVDGKLNNIAVTSATASVTDDIIALKIERFGNIWRFYYSTAQSPNYDWIKVTQIEDSSDFMTRTISLALFAYTPADADNETLAIDFDNFKYYTNFGYVEHTLSQLVSRGNVALVGTCNSNMVASTTSIVADNLIGYGDDAFNSGYQMIILRNANSSASAPEMEMRDITDYVSATGTFTVEAFSANVEASDIVLVIHNSIASSVVETGVATGGSTTTLIDTDLTQGDDYWNGSTLLMLSGASRHESRPIVDFDAGTDTITVRPAFTSAIVATDRYVILSEYHEVVPTADATDNYQPRDVVGNKEDAADFTWDATTSSMVKLIKGILGVEVIEEGTLTTDSATVPADTVIGGTYGNDYFNGSWLMTVSGNAKFQPRLIVDFATTTGVFTLDPEHPFTVAPGTVAYVILSRNDSLVPAANGTNNYTPAHVTGNKATDAAYFISSTSDMVAYLKGILSGLIVGHGTFTTSSATVPADTGYGAKASNYFNGCLLIPLTGDDAFQPRLIVGFTTATGVFTIDPSHPFTAATGLVNYIILAAQGDLVATANNTDNTTLRDVAGNKTDAATLDNMTALATASLVAEVKRILLRMSTDAFTADIQGSARVELDTMLAQMATYFSAAGAAWSVQVNNLTARTNLEQVLEDYFGVIGCDNTNVFNPDIQGSARTTLDAALAALATYVSAAGAAYSVQMNNQTARTNMEQTFEDLTVVLGVDGTNTITNINNSANVTFNAVCQKFAAVLGCDGVNVFNPTVQGVARTTLEAAIEALASYFVLSSGAYSAKVNNQTLRTNLEQILQDYFAVVGCDGTNAFGTTIQGSGRTTIEAAFDALATYFVASGAAYSKKVNNLTLRTNLEDILQDLFAVVGCDNTNVFEPSIGGSTRTTMETAFAALGTAFGAEYDGTPDLYDVTVTGYDSSAITSNADGSILEREEYIQTVVNAITTLTETGGTVTTDGTEQNVYINDAPAALFKPICVKVDFTNHTATESVTLRTYYRIKSAGNYIKQSEVSWLLSVPNPLLVNISLEPNRYGVKVTIQKTAGTNRAYDWEAIYEE